MPYLGLSVNSLRAIRRLCCRWNSSRTSAHGFHPWQVLRWSRGTAVLVGCSQRSLSRQFKYDQAMILLFDGLTLLVDNGCIELAQNESEVEYLLSWVKQSADPDIQKVSQHALSVIDTLARNGKSMGISSLYYEVNSRIRNWCWAAVWNGCNRQTFAVYRRSNQHAFVQRVIWCTQAID